MKFVSFLAHLLTPRGSNNHKPKLLHNSSIFFLAFAFIGLQALIQVSAPITGNVLGYATNISPDEIIRLTNVKRAENGLSPLTYNATLSQAALAKGNDMINKNYWAHVAPDGTQPWAFFLNAGYKYKYAGENLARDFNDSASTVDAWMASPSHRENMLSPNYKEIGVAVVNGSLTGSETTLVVQFFGTGVSETIPVQQASAAELKSPVPSPIALGVANSSPSPKPVADAVPSSAPIGQTIVSESSTQPLFVSPFDLTRSISLVVVILLIAVMVVDYVIISRKNIRRVGGRPFAHIAFLGMIAALLIIAKVGRII